MVSRPSQSSSIAHEKRTLASILTEHRTLPTAQAIDVALDVCDALAAAHANGVVHGDLGPQCVKLAWPPDAGAEKGQRAGGVDIFGRHEDSGVTPHPQLSAMIAPEQRDTSRLPDARTDVWAVGNLLHRMLGGVVLNGRPSTLVRVPRSLVVIIEACLSGDPEERPLSVDDLSEKIASFASSPADRFERLAQRRAANEKLASALERAGAREASSVLDRLDEAALSRAKETPAPEPVVEETVPLVPAASENRLVIASVSLMEDLTPGPGTFEAKTRVAIDPVDAVAAVAAAEAMPDSQDDEELAPLDAITLDDDEGEDLETQWAGTEPLTMPLEARVAALSIAPVEVPADREEHGMVRSDPPPAMPSVIVSDVERGASASKRPGWISAVAFAGIGLCLVIGIGAGIQITRYATRTAPPQAAAAAQPIPVVEAPKPVETPKAEEPKVVAAKPVPPKASASASASSVPVFEVVAGQVVRTATPDSLPDAK